MTSPTRDVLLIDDDVAMRSMLVRAMTRSGYVVHEAGDGHEGLRILEERPIGLVITDIIMPELEGVELIFRIRKTNKTIPIIAMSGGGRMSPKGYLDVAKSCGASRSIAKPFEIDQLLSCVAELLAGTGTGSPERTQEKPHTTGPGAGGVG